MEPNAIPLHLSLYSQGESELAIGIINAGLHAGSSLDDRTVEKGIKTIVWMLDSVLDLCMIGHAHLV